MGSGLQLLRYIREVDDHTGCLICMSYREGMGSELSFYKCVVKQEVSQLASQISQVWDKSVTVNAKTSPT